MSAPVTGSVQAVVVDPETVGRHRTIVTIDGPAGTGKSSVSQRLASRLGLQFLDTGAMYRAAAVVVIDRQLDIADVAGVCEVVAACDLHFDWRTDPPALLVNGQNVMHRIRDDDVTRLVSPLAGIGRLREHMVRKQRIIANQHPRLVSEGRDQGSVVFPDAEVKFYLDARPEIRAARRTAELRAKGKTVDEKVVLREIIERDLSDSTRTDGPLTVPLDAIEVDTSDLDRDQVIDLLERHVRIRVGLS
ncbi:MAG: (d)CMP kinase [bacterium]|jgi:cytidylate kinase|nr:(d)CMP kinase [Planctomycetaceae bacterium]